MIKGIVKMTKKALAGLFAKRAELAGQFRQLAQDWSKNTVEMGQTLAKAKETFPKRGQNLRTPDFKGTGALWEHWVTKEAGISRAQADRLIQIASIAPAGAIGWRASKSVLKLIATSEVPKEAREHVIERLDKGEAVTAKDAKEIIDRVKHGKGITRKEIKKISSFMPSKDLPKPKEARKQALETKSLVLASDGNFYTPATDAQIEVAKERRTLVFNVRRAVETLSTMKMTPKQFLDYAPETLLWVEDGEAVLVAKAAEWLDDLAECWEPMAKKLHAARALEQGKQGDGQRHAD